MRPRAPSSPGPLAPRAPSSPLFPAAAPAAPRPAVGPLPARTPSSPGPLPPRAPSSPAIPAAAVGPTSPAASEAGAPPSTRQPSSKVDLPAPPLPRTLAAASAKPAPEAEPLEAEDLEEADVEEEEEKEEVEASTSVIDPEAGGSLLAKMTEAEKILHADDELDGDGPTIVGTVDSLSLGASASEPPPAAGSADMKRAPAAGAPGIVAAARAAFSAQASPSSGLEARPPATAVPARRDEQVAAGEEGSDEATLALAPGEFEAAMGGPPEARLAPAPFAAPPFAPGPVGGAPAFPVPPGPPGYPMPPSGPAGSPPALQPAPQAAPWTSEPVAPSSGFGAPGAPGASPMLGAISPSGQYPVAYPRQGPVQTSSANLAPWPAPPNTPKSSSARTQLIILGIVGVICLGIFATGLYLFFTTVGADSQPLVR